MGCQRYLNFVHLSSVVPLWLTSAAFKRQQLVIQHQVCLQQQPTDIPYSSGVDMFTVSLQDVSEVPTPKNSSVKIRQEPGGLYGVDLFSGNAKQPRVNEREQQLRSWLQRDGTKPASDEWILAEYNVPWQLPGFKRNEILIPIDESTFELW